MTFRIAFLKIDGLGSAHSLGPDRTGPDSGGLGERERQVLLLPKQTQRLATTLAGGPGPFGSDVSGWLASLSRISSLSCSSTLSVAQFIV